MAERISGHLQPINSSYSPDSLSRKSRQPSIILAHSVRTTPEFRVGTADHEPRASEVFRQSQPISRVR